MHLRSPTIAALLIPLLAVSSAARAAADPKVRAVQIATLAQLAPLTCDGLSTDREAIAAFLAKAGVTDADLHGAFQGAMREVAATLASSVRRNKMAACSQLWDELGDDGLGLVARPRDGE